MSPTERATDRDAVKGRRRARFMHLCNNPLSILGSFLVAAALALLLMFGLFLLVSPRRNPYLDIVGFLILPGVLVAGLVIVPVGMALKQWLRRPVASGYPALDLNDPRTRTWLGAFLGFSLFVVMPVLLVTSYYGYGYTESTEFCGGVCHTVMEPQATAHANSPHARVSCAECHIGAGASWFVKAKVSGLRQVLAVWRDSYSRPIPPAITELRPARETCEECHWPAKFFGSQYRELVHFSPDERNTRRTVKVFLKTGGADESVGRVEGIHMHMVLAGRIEYVATDEHLQEIPWVRYVSDAGETLIFRSDGKSSSDPRPEGLVRQIDCMDCHNRGAHHFRSPQSAVNLYLDVDRIDSTLPYIKREAVAALAAEYADLATVEVTIADRLTGFYRANYPEEWRDRRAAVDQAVAAVGEIYRRNVFPAMRVRWGTYPENIGHLESPGCLRCHDGRHVDQFGGRISSDCDVCHVFLNPVEEGGEALVAGEFQHSMDLVLHGNLQCSQCHTGGPLPLCRTCHESGEWMDDRGAGRFRGEATRERGN